MSISSVRFVRLTVLSLGLLVASAAGAQTPTASAAAAPAPAGARWEKLGERTVDAKLDRDTITVGRDDGLFDAIQIKADGSKLALFELKIVFGNGEVFEPKVRLVFDKNTTSRVIDLPGAKRAIKRVELKYVDLPGGGKARLELHGREVPASWDRLGAREVDGKLDRDAIAVTSDDGQFTAIQLKVENSSLVLSDLKITFANGEVFEPKTRLVFEKDSKSRVIDLPGNRRAIRRVEFRYGNLPGGGKAKIELSGRH